MTLKFKKLDDEIQSLAGQLGIKVGELSGSARLHSAWDSTCLLIREDNLLALKALAFTDMQVNFCYIDPPYNTGNSFVYDDNRRAKSGNIWGSHGPWMEFMLPRLVYARELLSENGIIAISIDDYACSHLKILMDLVFGEQCALGTLIVTRSTNGLGSNRNVASMHEYVILYGRSGVAQLRGVPEGKERLYGKHDEHGDFTVDGLFRKKGEASLRSDRPNMYYPLYVAQSGEVFTERTRDDLLEVFPCDSKGVERRWLWGKDKATAESWKLYGSPKGVIYVKNYRAVDKRVKLRSILTKPSYLTDTATREIKAVYGEKLFDTPKPVELIKDLVDACTNDDALILDFFAGSGTTAEAVAALNSGTDVVRRVILVEHESPIESRHIASKAGFLNTADLTEFRLKNIENRYPKFSYTLGNIVGKLEI